MKKFENTPLPPGKICGYIRASTSKQIASPETQRQIIVEHCARQGLGEEVAFYIDAATTSHKDLYSRPAGNAMMLALCAGDTVVIARLDRLSRSFVEFAGLLDQFMKRRIQLRICDWNGAHFDPANPMSCLLVHMLISFAEYERALISQRTKEGLHALKAQGKKYCSNAPYGYEWIKKSDPKTGEMGAELVANETERMLMAKVVEMRDQGYSADEIRQYIAYEWKMPTNRKRTRTGKEWSNAMVYRLIQYGVDFFARERGELKEEEAGMPYVPFQR